MKLKILGALVLCGLFFTFIPSSIVNAATPAIDIEKSTNGEDADVGPGPSILWGDTVTWTYVVTNTGDVPLTGVSIWDTRLDYENPIFNRFDPLLPGESFTHTETGTSYHIGQYSNSGRVVGYFDENANGTDPDDPQVEDTDNSHYFGEGPEITIDKITLDGVAEGDGLNILTSEPIKWRYTVTNTGNVPLSNVVVTDNQSGVVPTYSTGDINNDGILDLNETWIYEASGTAITGSYTNNGTATADFSGYVVEASDISAYFGVDPKISIEKITVDNSATGDGLNILTSEPIKWRYTISNTGNVPLSSVTVTDNQPGVTPIYISGDINTDEILDLAETWIYEASGTAITGIYNNTGTVSGSYADSAGHIRSDSATNSSSYFGADPQISLVKTTTDKYGNEGGGVGIIPGDDVTWRYVVTNVGNIPLSDVIVTDNQSGVAPTHISGDINTDGKLDLAETWVYEAYGIAATGHYSNTGDATGSYTDSAGHVRSDTATEESSYYGLNGGYVTSSSLCEFGDDFTLVFTPDIQNWPGHYKLSSSKPGQFYYNLFYLATGDTITVEIPYPFITQGAMPVHVYSGVFVQDNDNGGLCFLPGDKVLAISSQLTLEDRTLILEGLPDNGFVYVAIHLDYGLKGTKGWTKGFDDDALHDTDINPGYSHILSQTEYTFSADIADSEDNVWNLNNFKNLKGFGGLVLDGAGEGIEGEVVELWTSEGTFIQTMTTDENGWYWSNYVHNGKNADYKLVLGDQEIVVKVGGKVRFGEGNFALPY